MEKRSQGYTFRLEDLFMTYDVRKLKITADECEKIYKNRHKKALCARVLKASIKLILEDILENDITFNLPTGGKRADIHMKKFEGEEFDKCRKLGKFRDVDFLKSYFTAYQPCLYMYTNNRLRVKPIYTAKSYTDRLTEKTNAGAKYC